MNDHERETKLSSSRLVDSLVTDLKPVTPVRLLKFWSSSFGLCALATGVLWTALFSVRADLSTAIANPVFLVSVIGAGIGALVTTFTLISASLPGRKETPFVANFTIGILLGVFAIFYLMQRNTPSQADLAFTEFLGTVNVGRATKDPDFACTISVFLLGIIPFSILYFRLFKLAPVAVWQIRLFSAAAAVCFGAFALGFSCLNDHPAHHLGAHWLFPIALFLVLTLPKRMIHRW